MECVEPVSSKDTLFNDDDEADDDYDQVTVELEKGLVLDELKSDRGTQFEIKAPVDLPDPDTNAYFETEEVFKQLNRECLGEDDDTDEGLSPFEKMAKKMEDITPEKDRKVLKSTLRQGTGPLPVVGMTLTVHYNCYVEYSDEPYDSSRLRNKPERFKLGEGRVIPGMELGMGTMRQGETSKFLIHPDLAFGSMGVPPRIPANATILVEIELQSMTDRAELDEFNNMSEEERKEVTFKRKLKVVDTERKEGNELFENSKYNQALSKYLRALKILEGATMRNDEEERKMNSAFTALCLNIALCSARLKTPERVITYCNRVLEIDNKNVKALYRKGMALMELKDFKGAHQSLTKVQQIQPSNSAVLSGLRELEKMWKCWKLMERSQYGNMFPNWKNDAKPKEDAKIEKKVPEDVQKSIREKLQTFQEAKNTTMTLPVTAYTAPEIGFLEAVAKEFGMTFHRREVAGEKIIKITKEQPPGNSKMH